MLLRVNVTPTSFRYLTLVSDLELAPDTDQFVASPPVRYINVLGWLKFDRGGGVQESKKLKPLWKSDN